MSAPAAFDDPHAAADAVIYQGYPLQPYRHQESWMDAIELLSHDHRMVEQLFRDYEAAATGPQRRKVVEILIRELSKHAALVELIIYPLAKDVLPDGHSAVEERLNAHLNLKFIVDALDKLPAESREATDHLMAKLQQAVAKHVRVDEGELLPKLRDAVDQKALDELGHVLDQAKKVAPARPYPHAPDQPPALILAAPAAAAYDRLRDRLQHRPKT